MPEIHGKDGSVQVNGTAVAYVDSWDATIGAAHDDITAMDSGGWQKMMAGIKKVSGSVKVRYATDDTNGQTVLQTQTLGGTAVVLRLYASGTANYLSGSAFLEESKTVSHNSPGERTFNFDSTGIWAYT